MTHHRDWLTARQQQRHRFNDRVEAQPFRDQPGQGDEQEAEGKAGRRSARDAAANQRQERSFTREESLANAGTFAQSELKKCVARAKWNTRAKARRYRVLGIFVAAD